MRLFIGSKLEINDGFWYDVKIHKVIIYHLDGIALGLLAAYIKRFAPELWNKSRNITFILGLIICLLMPYINWNPSDTLTIVFKISMQSLSCFLLLPRFETIKSAPKALTKVVTHISLISYSMYLINLSMVASVITTNVEISGKAEAILWYAVYWIAVVLVSTIIYKFYEKPIMDLRDKI
ncbi:MAG: hypothetical protein II401_09450 [Bacteroidales bacterium]|nr:hypothetical protein [Bacteroidales bacterium]